MMNFKKSALLIIAMFLSFATLQAQDMSLDQKQAPDIDPVTDAEIKSLVKINLEIQPIQQALQGKMIEEVEDSGMELERFSELMGLVQQGQEIEEVEASDEEKETISKVVDKLTVLENESDMEIEKLIEENGFELERFQEVFAALQSDPEVQERFMAAMSEATEQG